MRLRSRPAFLCLGICLLGCSETLPLTPTDQDRLDIAEQQWANRGFTDYSVDMVHICECPPSFRDRARVEVVGGTVSRVTLLGTLAVITDSRTQLYRTVEDVFHDIRSANENGSWQSVSFSVDPVLGLPTFVHWAAKASAPELELIIEITNPQPLSPFPLPR